MDQKAFRQLLSTPRADSGQQSSSSASSSSPFRPRQFGKVQKRGGQSSSETSAALLPRKVGGSSKSESSSSSNAAKEPIINSSTGEAYVDRAEARRLGREEEDTDGIEADERKRRDEDAGIVKGLDFALLAKQKAKLNGSEGLNDDDDDLEQAYGSSSKPEEGEGESSGKKKEVAMPSKFRPIGSKGKDGKKAAATTLEEEAPEYIWRDGKRMRKKKKKKKEEEEDPIADGDRVENAKESFKAASTSNGVSIKPEQRTKEKQKTNPEEAKALIQKSPPSVKENVQPPLPPPKAERETSTIFEEPDPPAEDTKGVEDSSDDEGSDIFADAGRWQGLDDSDEEGEEDEAKAGNAPGPAAVALSAAPSGRRDWFGDMKESSQTKESDEVSVKLPSGLQNIVGDAKQAQLSQAKRDAEGSSGSEESDGDEDVDEEAAAASAKPQRLEGFSDSILGREGVRYMLDKKDDDGPDRKRKRKRSKKGKGGYGSD